MLDTNRTLLGERLYSLEADELIVLHRAHMGYSDEQIVALFTGECRISALAVDAAYKRTEQVFCLEQTRSHEKRRAAALAMYRVCVRIGLTRAEETDASVKDASKVDIRALYGESNNTKREREAKERLARCVENVPRLTAGERLLLVRIGSHGHEAVRQRLNLSATVYHTLLERIIGRLEIPPVYTFNKRVHLAISALKHSERNAAAEARAERMSKYVRKAGSPKRRPREKAAPKVQELFGFDVNSTAFKAIFEANIARLARVKCMSMAALAAAIGKGQPYFWGLRHDQRTLTTQTAIRCAEVLGVPPEVLVTDKVLQPENVTQTGPSC